MCRLVFYKIGKKENHHFYVGNDELSFELNWFIERYALPKIGEKRCEIFKNILGILLGHFGKGRLENSLEDFISCRKVVEAIRQRIENSRRLFEKENFINLKTFKVFCFFKGKWKELKGKSARKTPFGLWENKKKISKLMEIGKDCELLICERRKKVE